MRECGIDVIRVSEFAWNLFEPVEGQFTFDFFDGFLALALVHGMKVIFCTPTATPPAWASARYPEILNADLYGHQYQHGLRRHYNYNSWKYLELTDKIVTAIAGHYGKHEAIIGWQIDNEINCELNEFYSESDRIAFRAFLKDKYNSLDALNQAWGTVFWNQTYTGWDEVNLPGLSASGSHNPHQMLDYKRFVSDSARKFVKLQSDILRRNIRPDMFVTTNGIFGNLDSHEMTKESLDFITYDSYPNMAYCLDADPKNNRSLLDRKWSNYLALTRSISPHFGIMEQQTGANGWTSRLEAPAPKPGQMTLWTMQSVAYGADFVSYFRWRTAGMGTEMYWQGILDADNRDTRRLAEVKDIHQKISMLQEMAGADYVAKMALVSEYHNIWDGELDKNHGRYAKESANAWFVAAQQTHAPMDQLYILESTSLDDLLKYEVLIYPHPVILTDETAALLLAYVVSGGKLIMGCQTGMKDETGKCPMGILPRGASDICGVEVVDHTFLGEMDGEVNVMWDGEVLQAPIFNDILQPVSGGEVLGCYDGNYYKGCPGLVAKRYGNPESSGVASDMAPSMASGMVSCVASGMASGKAPGIAPRMASGMAYYFGGAFSVQSAGIFLKKLNLAEPYKEVITLPESCEIAVREKSGKRYYFILNYGSDTATITVNQSMHSLFADKAVQGRIEIEAYGVLVLS
jgi:beta-galactosidase